jgi:hypothetical protein
MVVSICQLFVGTEQIEIEFIHDSVGGLVDAQDAAALVFARFS